MVIVVHMPSVFGTRRGNTTNRSGTPRYLTASAGSRSSMPASVVAAKKRDNGTTYSLEPVPSATGTPTGKWRGGGFCFCAELSLPPLPR